MIVIKKDNDSEIAVTVINKTGYPFYLLQLQNVTTLKNYYKVINPSVSTERAIIFEYLQADAQELNVGQHTYKMYGQASPTNLDPSTADELISYGVATVTKLDEIVKYQTTTIDKVYER